MIKSIHGVKPPLISAGTEPFEQRLREGSLGPREPFRRIKNTLERMRAARSLPTWPEIAAAVALIPEYRSRSAGRHRGQMGLARRGRAPSRYVPRECDLQHLSDYGAKA